MMKLRALNQQSSALTRREFLVGMSGTSLVFTFAGTTLAAMNPGVPGGTPPAISPPAFQPTLWYSIDATGAVTVNIIRAEMGQHVGTAIARIAADELEADWDKVRIVHVDTDPKWGLMVTGGSWSVWQSWPLYSRAGAAGRIALLEAGAKLLGAPVSGCTARSGAIESGGRKVSYGDIVRRGNLSRRFSPEELAALPIKPAAERRLVGREVQALDIATKTNGSARYGIDASVPNMVYGRPKVPPTRYGSRATAVDDSAARNIKGYLRSIVLEDPSDTVPGWVMVVATTYPAAIRAADLVKVTWTPGPTAAVSEEDLQAHAATLIGKSDSGVLLNTDGGDAAAAFKAAQSTLEQTYTTSTVMHFQLEPVNALAFERDGVFEIHTGNQWQSLILPTLAKALQRPQDSIIMRTYLLGGGFGRRLNGDYAVPAALAAKVLGQPLKMILTRADDARFDSVRSPSVHTLRMAFDANRKVTAMECDVCAGWPTLVMA
ncbi:MAG: molybdopterin cofactor-binding domain-containing protein, partial [Steroidobacteraceae bacterium]